MATEETRKQDILVKIFDENYNISNVDTDEVSAGDTFKVGQVLALEVPADGHTIPTAGYNDEPVGIVMVETVQGDSTPVLFQGPAIILSSALDYGAADPDDVNAALGVAGIRVFDKVDITTLATQNA